MVSENQIFDIKFHESTHTYANPYQLWIELFIPDERFYFYLKDICNSKRVVLYFMEDEFLKRISFGKFGLRILVDRIDNLLKAFKGNVLEKDVVDLDLTAGQLTYGFSTKKERTNFRNQFEKGVRTLILFEYKNYVKILNEMGVTIEIDTIIGNDHIISDSSSYIKEVKETSETILLNKPQKSKVKFFRK